MSRHDPSPLTISPPGGRGSHAPREASFDRPAPLSASAHEILRPTVAVMPMPCGELVAADTSVTAALQCHVSQTFPPLSAPANDVDNSAAERVQAPTTRTRDQTGATICPRCLGAGRLIHPFPHPCGECGGSGWRLLLCTACDGYGEDSGQEPCDRCNGRGVRACVEPRCTEDATHTFTERGYGYALCATHHRQWKEDAEA